MTKLCVECGKEFKPRAGRFETAKWCGSECATIGKRKAFTCNTLRAGIKPTNAYAAGDNAGDSHPRWKGRSEFVCKMCGAGFAKERWRANQMEHTNEFCSVKCRSEFKREFLSGENAPDWVGGPQTYRGRSFTDARVLVILSQKGKCNECGTFKGNSLPVHHIKPFREFDSVEDANRESNLVGLCQSCHMKIEPRTKKGHR